MFIQADAITLKRLVLVKHLYQQALVQATSQRSVTSRIMSVIGFDLAVETVLKIVIALLDPNNNPKAEYKFHEYRDKADALMIRHQMASLPDKRNITYVHGIRNDAQHNAKYPNESDVSDCRTYVRDFLQRIIMEVWNLSLDKISLSDLIEDKKSKELLRNAESALSVSHQTAAEQAVAAVTWAMGRTRNAIVGESEQDKHWGEFLVKKGLTTESSGIAYRALWTMQEIVLIIAVGIDYADYMYYQKLMGELKFAAGFFLKRDEPSFDRDMSGRSVTADDAEFLVAYCTDTILRIESRVGNIESPFGL